MKVKPLLKKIKYENIYLILLFIYFVEYIKADISNILDLITRIMLFGGFYIILKLIRLENKKSVNARSRNMKR